MSIPGRLNDSLPSLLCLCIEHWENGDFSGLLYDRCSPDPQPVADCRVFLSRAQDLFDRLGYPQASVYTRSFSERTPAPLPITGTGQTVTLPADRLWQQRGRMATVMLGVTSRANATWQGLAVHVESGESLSFSSELELVRWLQKLGQTAAPQ